MKDNPAKYHYLKKNEVLFIFKTVEKLPTYIKFNVKFIFQQVMYVPAFPKPSRTKKRLY